MQVQEEDYFCYVTHRTWHAILHDIREAHKDDTDSAPDDSNTLKLLKDAQRAMAVPGSYLDVFTALMCTQLQIRYEKLSEQERTANGSFLLADIAYVNLVITVLVFNLQTVIAYLYSCSVAYRIKLFFLCIINKKFLYQMVFHCFQNLPDAIITEQGFHPVDADNATSKVYPDISGLLSGAFGNVNVGLADFIITNKSCRGKLVGIAE